MARPSPVVVMSLFARNLHGKRLFKGDGRGAVQRGNLELE